jgi:Rieske Fe-S protein
MGSPMNRRGFIRTTAIAAGALIFGRTQSAVAAAPKKIIKVSKFPVGASQQFVATNGAPAFLFRTKTGVFAYSAICTHQGCTVEYLKAGKKLVCPCHRASFDPFNGGKVISGEAKGPLAKINVSIKSGWVVQS